MRPAAIRKLGVDYDRLSDVNPRLVYCGLYGYSDQGARAGYPAYDDIIQAAAGLATQQGLPAGCRSMS